MIRSWLIPQADGTMREVMPKPRLLMDDLQAIADAAVAGFGIAWLPCWLIRDALLEGRLQQVLGEVPGKDFEVHAVWPLTPHLPLKVRLAVDALVSHLAARMAL
jgi:DNA-binding transcriptional LysR family regulator